MKLSAEWTGYIAGVDVGGTKTLICVANTNGEIFMRKKIPTMPCEAPELFFQRVFMEIENLLTPYGIQAKTLHGLGIGFPGVVDEAEGVLTNAPALPWGDLNVRSLIRSYYEGALYLDNDVNLAAIGEKWLGAARGKDDFLMVTVGTGIGAALMLNGQLYKGAKNSAGEMGYFIISGMGKKDSSNSGRIEILEEVSSGTGIANYAKKILEKSGQSSCIMDMVNHQIDKVRSEHVLQAYSLGDELAVKILEKPLNYLAIGIANAISLLNPELVVIGGGVAEAGDIFLDGIRSKVKSYTPISTMIVPAVLGNEAGAIGGIAAFLGGLT